MVIPQKEIWTDPLKPSKVLSKSRHLSQLLLKRKTTNLIYFYIIIHISSSFHQPCKLHVCLVKMQQVELMWWSLVLAFMTTWRGTTIFSVEGNDSDMVYRDWVHTGGGIVYSWHFIFSVLLRHFFLLTGGKFEIFFSQSHYFSHPNAIQTESWLEGIWNELLRGLA